MISISMASKGLIHIYGCDIHREMGTVSNLRIVQM